MTASFAETSKLPEIKPPGNRAADVLMFVPGAFPGANNSATRVVQLISQFASTARQGTYTVRIDSTVSGGTVLDPDGKPVLEVVEVDYQSRLNSAEPDGPSTDKGTLPAALLYTIWAALKLIRAFKRKSLRSRTKVQLAYGLFCVLLLFLSFLIIAAAVVAVFFPGILPTWTTAEPATKYVVGASAATLAVAAYWWLRGKILEAGRLLRALMRYVERDQQMLAVVDAFDEAYDAILDESPDANIHVLAYSFGSIVAIDSLFPRNSNVERRSLARLRSLVTIGSPFDFIRLYYPDHFDDRENPRVKDLEWLNIFTSGDVFGSDFKGDVDRTEGRERTNPSLNRPMPTSQDDPPTPDSESSDIYQIAGQSPTLNVKEGRGIKRRQILTLEGFQVHGSYWDRGEPRYLRSAIPKWVPPEDGEVVPRWVKEPPKDLDGEFRFAS
jgi:hypothetical protein